MISGHKALSLKIAIAVRKKSLTVGFDGLVFFKLDNGHNLLGVQLVQFVCFVQDGEFVWSKQTQGFVLGAFFWGYLITQIPGGLLAQKYGGKRVLGYCLLVASIATLLCAVGARVSPYLLIFLRIIIGLGQVGFSQFTPFILYSTKHMTLQ